MRSEMFSLQGRLPKLSRPSSTNVSAFAVPPAPHYPVTPGITYLRTVLLTSARRCARAARCAQSTETLAFSLSNVRGLFFLRPSFPITYTEIFRQSIIKHDLVFRQPRHLSPLFGLSDIGCNFNEFLYESSGRQRIGMVPRRQALRTVGKSPLPDDVVSASGYGCRYPESFITIPDPNSSGAVEGPPPPIRRNEPKWQFLSFPPP